MNFRAHIAVAFVIALGACGQPASAPETEAATATSEPAPAEGVPTRESLVGRWGDNGDCTKDVVFAADGTFHSYTGGSGAWTLEGDVLTMQGAEGTFQVHVAIANADTLMIGNADGSYGLSQRCP